ncbi:hypothetical protein CDAR_599831 [Caerostris darwini]|uniref:C2H2-type domain-containing protein n=1 Tax=Caerostris darwini TaxID=1538125 RepID=A0AAV4RAM9_9ARAC|nr:hypothetical protein CDAR_599831 [Caerostris darwini]
MGDSNFVPLEIIGNTSKKDKSEALIVTDVVTFDGMKDLQIQRFQCSLCPYVSNFKHNVQRHLMSHSGNKPFQCNMCQRKFIQKSDLKIHMLRHAKEKPFRCDLCPKAYPSRSALNFHNRITHCSYS